MLPLLENEGAFFPVLEENKNLNGITTELYNVIQKLPSLLILEKFKELANIQTIAVVGSSASGKSTLINQLRLTLKDSKDVTIPIRYITRAQRFGDDLTENRHLSVIDFQKQVKSGDIPICWMRKMEGDRIEHYGFKKTDPQKLTLYSANNDFFRQVFNANKMIEQNYPHQKKISKSEKKIDKEHFSINERIATLSKTLLILGVYASDEVRKKRLYDRSPDLTVSEKEYRIGDSSDNIIPYCHILLKNYAETEESALKDIVSLVKNVVALRVKWGEIRDLGNHITQYSSRLFDIVNHQVLFSDGTIKKFEYVERSPGVRTLITDGYAILVTKEWREELGKWDIRLPGGKLFETIKDYKSFKQQNSNKDLLIQEARKAAQKETLEEVGMNLNTERFELAHISKCGAVINWDLYYFSVKVKEKITEHSQIVTSENETILNTWLSYEETKELCLSGQISEDRTSNFLLRYIYANQK